MFISKLCVYLSVYVHVPKWAHTYMSMPVEARVDHKQFSSKALNFICLCIHSFSHSFVFGTEPMSEIHWSARDTLSSPSTGIISIKQRPAFIVTGDMNSRIHACMTHHFSRPLNNCNSSFNSFLKLLH